MNARKHTWAWLALLAALVLYPAGLLAQPPLIHYQGRLVDGTNLVNGSVGLSLRLYDAALGGTLLYEDSSTVAVVDGLYVAVIGDQPAITNTLVRALLETNVHLEVVVDGVPLDPREPLVSVPYALATRDLVLTPLGNMLVFPERNTMRNDEFGFFGSTIAGGTGNLLLQSADSVIAGGRNNVMSNLANVAFIGGGFRNFIDSGAAFSVIVGGENNRMRNASEYGAIGGGRQNIIEPGAAYATIPGGVFNRVGTNAIASMAAGTFAEALHMGSFVWADQSGVGPFRTTANQQFLIREIGVSQCILPYLSFRTFCPLS